MGKKMKNINWKKLEENQKEGKYKLVKGGAIALAAAVVITFGGCPAVRSLNKNESDNKQNGIESNLDDGKSKDNSKNNDMPDKKIDDTKFDLSLKDTEKEIEKNKKKNNKDLDLSKAKKTPKDLDLSSNSEGLVPGMNFGNNDIIASIDEVITPVVPEIPDQNLVNKPSGSENNKPGNKPGDSGNNKPGNKPGDSGNNKPGNKPGDSGNNKPEDKHKHNISTITELLDNGNGTHTITTKEVCSAGDYTKIISASTENCQYTDWYSIGSEGEKRTCGTCSHDEQRGHSLGEKVTSTYQYNGNGTHSSTTTQSCCTCDYEISTADTQTCDMTGTPYTASDGLSVKVGCSSCDHEEVIHTHTLVTEYEEANDACCKAVTTCQDNNCPTSYYDESLVPHNFEDTDTVNEWDQLLKQVCSNCGAENWISWTPTTQNVIPDTNPDMSGEVTPDTELSSEINDMSNEELASYIVDQYATENVDAKMLNDSIMSMDYSEDVTVSDEVYETETEQYETVKTLVLN